MTICGDSGRRNASPYSIRWEMTGSIVILRESATEESLAKRRRSFAALRMTVAGCGMMAAGSIIPFPRRWT